MAVKMYKAALKPCPFCGNAEQTVFGVEVDGGWKWNVECDFCKKYYDTEKEALEAWKRRYKEHEVEQDGDITWDFFDLWVKCAKRYAKECLGGIGTDRSDSGSGLDT